jgi:hypothetical protein
MMKTKKIIWLWSVRNERWKMEHGRWKMEVGSLQMADVERTTEQLVGSFCLNSFLSFSKSSHIF